MASIRIDIEGAIKDDRSVRAYIVTMPTTAFAETHSQTAGSVDDQIISTANSSFVAVSHCSPLSMRYNQH